MSVETDTTSGTAEVLSITEEALARVKDVLIAEDDPDSLALRVEVVGASGTDYTYDLAFEAFSEAQAADHVQTHGELRVVVPEGSVEKLSGAVLDVPADSGQGGLVIRNPNSPNPLLGAEDLSLTGDTAEKIQQLLAEAINPSLASHGGFASLVGVDGSRVFLAMGGGCQGCALSQATMVQGIASAIRESVPEVTEVIDATDHSAGENPFYT